MKKYIVIILAMLGILSMVACGKDNVVEKESIVSESDADTIKNSEQNEPYIVKTCEQTPAEQTEECFDNGTECILTTYYEMSDGTWKTEDYTYQYRLEVFGRMNSAIKDITYIILSNTTDITFEQAWKASGLSSSMSDYFDPEDAKIVGMISSEKVEKMAEETDVQWGITLSTKNVTPTGLTIVCTQSAGSPSGELNSGSWYVVEQYVDGAWIEVKYLPQEYEIGWDSVAYIIPMEDTVEWNVNWEWLYGELPSGQYRIGKEIMDFRGPGDYNRAVFYTEFEIE